MKKFLCVILMSGISYLFAAGGTKCQYVSITSSGITPITFTSNSSEIYIIKLSTMEAFVNWTSTDMPMTAYTTNYFLLPLGLVISDTYDQLPFTVKDYYEHTEEFVEGVGMSIFQPLVAGTTNDINIRVQIKSW